MSKPHHPAAGEIEMGIRHVAPKGIQQAAWTAMLKRKADHLEEEIRELKDRRQYAEKRERAEIDEEIEKTEAILCGMHC
jgi:cell division protein FtsB